MTVVLSGGLDVDRRSGTQRLFLERLELLRLVAKCRFVGG
jgi:hypothetical protein